MEINYQYKIQKRMKKDGHTEEGRNTIQEQLEKDKNYMHKALVEALQAAEEGEIPIGAIIVCQDHIISRAHNMTETLHDVTAHAEMQAITAAADALNGKYLTDCTLYVTIEPCSMCAAAIGWAQIPHLVFGASDEKRGYRKYAPHVLHPKTTVTTGILEDECKSLLQDFFRDRR
jgi:tRNA(adenine34) deaminase